MVSISMLNSLSKYFLFPNSSVCQYWLLLLLLSRFSRVWLCATPWRAAHQALPSLGFSERTGVGCHFLLQGMKVKSESEVAQSCLTLVTPWTAAYQASLSMGFSRHKYWSGVPLHSPVSIGTCYEALSVLEVSSTRVIVEVKLGVFCYYQNSYYNL